MDPQYLYLGRESFGRLHHEVKALHHLCCSYKPAGKFMGDILMWGKIMSFSLFIHYQRNNVGHVKCYTWRIYTPLRMATYKGLL